MQLDFPAYTDIAIPPFVPIERETKGITKHYRHCKQNFRHIYEHAYTQTPLTLSKYRHLLYCFNLPCELCLMSEYTVKREMYFLVNEVMTLRSCLGQGRK